jgi:pimeloyl-ACP methyl ester carboxylesterase
MARIFRSDAGKALIHGQYRSVLDRWPVPRRELRIPTCQGETFVVDCGPEGAPPVILLHGGATTSAMWVRSVRAWAESFRLYAIDIIGEPGFSAPSRPAFASDAHARWMDDLWSALHLERASIVGASLGGLLALDYAIRRPEKVQSLVLLAPAGVAHVRLGYLASAVPLFFAGRWGRRKALSLVMGLPREEMTPAAEDFLKSCEVIMAHHVIRTQPLPVFSDDMLRRLTMPILAIVGGRDIVFSARTTRQRLAALTRKTKIVCLAAAGHGLTDQTRTVLEFLSAETAIASSSFASL